MKTNPINVLVACSATIDAAKIFRCLGKTTSLAFGVGPPHSISSKSRYCSRYFSFAGPNLADETDCLASFIQSNGITCLVTSDDASSRILRQMRGMALPTGFYALAPSNSQYSLVDDKFKFYNWCASNEICTPRTWNVDILQRAVDYPLVVKKRTGSGGKGYFLIKDRESALIAYDKIGEDSRSWMVQDFVSGTDLSVNAACVEGRVIAFFTQTCVSQRGTLGHQSVFLVSHQDNNVSSIAKSVLEQLSWHGPAVLDFRVNSTNAYLLEINSRFGRGVEAGLGVGVNLPAKLVGAECKKPNKKTLSEREFAYPSVLAKNPKMFFSAQMISGYRFSSFESVLRDPVPNIVGLSRKFPLRLRATRGG
ncbi:MAG: ATP-grasp domain-containing protein [Phycisphaerales bacterium]|nr:ATP-grasp domain-containing protein [Planctomycetota bacterium]MCH8507180.1 ATP-grasp domain-containing protein [Phycisphaerales bacterium]